MNTRNSVGIVGPGRIGKIYIREFIKLKYKKFLIFGSTKKKVKNLINLLKTKSIEASYVNSLEKIVKKCRFVCICSPTNTHLQYINFFKRKNIKVIVEKPLISQHDLNKINLKNSLKDLIFDKKQFLTSLPMFFYAKNIKKHLNLKSVKNITFKYHTNGLNKFNDIADDLLPHAISFIYVFFGKKIENIMNFKKKVSKNTWKCEFVLNKAKIIFDFSQNKEKESILEININQKIIKRQQKKKINGDLDIFMKIKDNEIKIKNPLSQIIKYNYNKLIESKNFKESYYLNYYVLQMTNNFIKNEKI